MCAKTKQKKTNSHREQQLNVIKKGKIQQYKTAYLSRPRLYKILHIVRVFKIIKKRKFARKIIFHFSCTYGFL